MIKKLVITLLTLICCEAVWGQTRVTGKVTDAKDNSPIAGAAVTVQGAQVGTLTDIDGRYVITVPQGGTTLVFSIAGYDTRSMAVPSGSGTLDAALTVTAQTIDEIVVTGFKNEKKETFTGASTKVRVDDAVLAGATDVSRMLEGQVAGVSVQNVSSTFGAAPKIRIRGVTSLSGENKPLWVVDGVVLEDVVSISNDQLSSGDPSTLLGSSVAGLNPADIESFDILKDAAATALYGARAMNGVVVITTKRGKQGAVQVNYSGNYTMRSKPLYSNYNIMNSADQMSVNSELERKGLIDIQILNAANSGVYGLMYKGLSTYDPATGKFALENTREARNAFLMRYAKANTDWFDVLFTNNIMHEHSLSISTGSERSRTYASLGLLRDGGWTIADNVSRYTMNFRNDYDISPKISIGVQAVASLRRQTVPGSFSRGVDPVSGTWSREFDINPFSYALNTSRAIRPYDDEGNQEYITMNYAPFNILNELRNNTIELDVIDTRIQGEFNYKIINGLTFNFTGALRYVGTDQVHKITEHSNVAGAYRAGTEYANYNSTIREANPYLWKNEDDLAAEPICVLPLGGFYNTDNTSMVNYDVRSSLSYNRVWRGNHLHEFSALGGTQVKYADRTIKGAIQAGYQYDMGGVVNNDPNYYRMAAQSQSQLYAADYYYDRFAAFYANADYAFDRKYSVSATLRVDGSNALGAGSSARWLPTWNVGGKWNISNEEFMSPLSRTIRALSLRASYGLNASMPPISNSTAVFYGQQVFRPGFTENQIVISSLENAGLTWEKSYQFNTGVDISLFEGRLFASLDYFNRQSFDLIAPIQSAPFGGEARKWANYADLSAYGFDFTVGGTMLRKGDWKWTANFTFGYSDNKIKNAKNAPAIYGLVRPEGGNKEGYAVNSLFSIPYAGLDPDTGIPLFHTGDGTVGQSVYMQSTDTGFLVCEGSVDPKYTGGLNTTANYKGLTLNVFFTYQMGNVIRLSPAFSNSYSDIYAMSGEFNERYQTTGDNQTPSIMDWVGNSLLLNGYPYVNYNYSTARVAKGDFIRLKSVMLSYDFNPAWISKSKVLRTASLRFTVKDPWLIYSDKKLNGMDPEFYGAGGVAMPTTRQFIVSLSLGF